jgi:transposase InsO family protein
MLAGVSRAAYYRHWSRSDPLREETGLRDVIQRLAVAHRFYGYRRIGALLRREGWGVNHKRLARIMREDKKTLPHQCPWPAVYRRQSRQRPFVSRRPPVWRGAGE